MSEAGEQEAFDRFVTDVEPRLRRALVSLRGREAGRDATAEALGWAWEHWDRLRGMDNPAGYLYRVGTTRSRPRPAGHLRVEPPAGEPSFEPGLAPALERLSDRQRDAVVLVHGCGWSLQEVATALDISKSSVAVHVRRGLKQLRLDLGVLTHD